MGLSKSELLLVISIFYAVLIVFMGFLGSIDNSVSVNYQSETEEKEVVTVERFGFLPNVIVGFSSVPIWLNAILFTPLAITLLFIIITTLGGVIFDGGS
jgi:hypothetical protein